MSIMALLIEQDRPASPLFPFLPRSHSFNDPLAAFRAASSGADSQASDSSRSGSPLKRRSVRWNRTKWSREPSQTDVSNSAFVQLEEGDFPLSHTRTLAVDADNDVDCGDSDCEIGYHSDTVDHEQLSKLITLRQVLAARQARRMYEQKDQDEDTDDALDEPYEQDDLPRHHAFTARRTRPDSDDGSSGGRMMDIDVDSVQHDEYEDDDEEEAESEYEAPVLRKRKRKDLATTTTTTTTTGNPTRLQSFTGRPSRAKFTTSGPSSSVGTPDAEDSPDVSFRPPIKKTGINRRMHGKRPRLETPSDNDKAQLLAAASGGLYPASATPAAPSVLEFPCRYVSPDGRPCAKKFPRWTDYEKHYESCHIGDSGYPWSYKVEAKDCPFRCPHPIPSASRPKSQKGRLVKTVEYGPCDFVTRKNTHDFERHWKGNHIRSEALFIARGNMQLEDAKWVNVKEKFEIAYALCPRCPRCSENFTRTDALTRHLRSPCSGGSVGAAIDDHLYAVQPAPTAVQFVEVKDAKAVKEMLDSQTTPSATTTTTHGPHHHPHHNAMLHATSQTLVTA
ncbi:hypothetical protein PIIN_07558 [Serendipita indica DSM 11827]|uniref:Uncharacterized protein n=1 Tax=Serendipita indica (strain DSM 11827) TaxID=1109443 RepID=G4TQL2_SERID|nr:hypothetical protein PIIN_07558 [Serendipita indica DSM 11827]